MKKIPMLERFAAQSLVEYEGELIFSKEKFAELLIDECIEQCSKALVEHTGQPSVTHNYAVGLCQDNIKEHFGVK